MWTIDTYHRLWRRWRSRNVSLINVLIPTLRKLYHVKTLMIILIEVQRKSVSRTSSYTHRFLWVFHWDFHVETYRKEFTWMDNVPLSLNISIWNIVRHDAWLLRTTAQDCVFISQLLLSWYAYFLSLISWYIYVMKLFFTAKVSLPLASLESQWIETSVNSSCYLWIIVVAWTRIFWTWAPYEWWNLTWHCPHLY